MKEVIVEGLEIEDFIVLERILKTYKASIEGDICFQDIINLHTKVEQIVKCLQD